MQPKYQYALIFFLLASAFSFSIWRDVQMEKQYVTDLRNRIVGARLQMDGVPPYFYKWKPSDGVRYYDPHKFDTTFANAITASPFLHHLLYPIANLPQRQISRIWLFSEYFALLLCLVFGFTFSKTLSQKWAISLVSSVFLFTQGWIVHIAAGQVYIFFSLLSFAFVFCIVRRKAKAYLFLAGIICAILIFSRPNAVLFFLPFLFLIRRFQIRNALLFSFPVIVLLLYTLINKNERSFWFDYKKGIEAHIRFHQSGGSFRIQDSTYFYRKWEGWDTDSIMHARHVAGFNLHIEVSSFWLLFSKIFHKKIPVFLLNALSLAIILALITVFFIRQKKISAHNIFTVAIFGFCLYMISDFFSPISRIQYYSAQWIFPLILIAAFYKPKLRVVFIFLMIGLLLNVLNIHYLKMRHLIGEMIILSALLWLCFSNKSKLVKQDYRLEYDQTAKNNISI